MAKIRLDLYLMQNDLAGSREEAQRYIRAGKVLVNENVIDKPGTPVDIAANIRVKKPETSFASRGGLKLEEALRRFSIPVEGKVAADLGASNGGFTDCLLQKNVKKVYAVDVGHGQLSYHLQTDPRVVVMDRTNCRYLEEKHLGEPVDLVVADLSFISIKTVFLAITRILKRDGDAVFLIKPQFEIGKGRVGKKGIVKDPRDHFEVLLSCYHFFHEQEWSVIGACPSPIVGKTGNIEFLLHIRPGIEHSRMKEEDLELVVSEAHEIHKEKANL